MSKLKIGLIVSVILNVFLIGGIAGGLTFWRMNLQGRARPAAAAPGQPRQALRFAADALGADQQHAFRLALREARQSSVDDLRSAQAHRRDLVGLIGAKTYDRAAVEQALDGARASDMAVRRRLEIAVADYAATLDADQRAAFVRGLVRSPTLRQAPANQNLAPPATETPPPAR